MTDEYLQEQQTEARKVTKLCSETILVLFDLLTKLQELRTAYDSIAYPEQTPGEASSGKNSVTREQFNKDYAEVSGGQTTVTDNSQPFTPITKDVSVKGNPLSELLHNLSAEDKAKLTTVLQQKVNSAKT